MRENSSTSSRRGRKGTLTRLEDKLLFILVYEQTYPLQTMLGLQFGLSPRTGQSVDSSVDTDLTRGIGGMGMTPERHGQAWRAVHWQGKASRIWSSTVQNAVVNVPRRRRPDRTRQWAKKAHTDKNLVLVNTHSQKVVYLSDTQAGKKHDKKQADEATICLSCMPRHAWQGYWISGLSTTGCDGLATHQETNRPTTQCEDKHLNALLSSARIVVEYAIGCQTLSYCQRCVPQYEKSDLLIRSWKSPVLYTSCVFTVAIPCQP